MYTPLPWHDSCHKLQSLVLIWSSNPTKRHIFRSTPQLPLFTQQLLCKRTQWPEQLHGTLSAVTWTAAWLTCSSTEAFASPFVLDLLQLRLSECVCTSLSVFNMGNCIAASNLDRSSSYASHMSKQRTKMVYVCQLCNYHTSFSYDCVLRHIGAVHLH